MGKPLNNNQKLTQSYFSYNFIAYLKIIEYFLYRQCFGWSVELCSLVRVKEHTIENSYYSGRFKTSMNFLVSLFSSTLDITGRYSTQYDWNPRLMHTCLLHHKNQQTRTSDTFSKILLLRKRRMGYDKMTCLSRPDKVRRTSPCS